MNILFLLRLLEVNGPRPIRAKNLAKGMTSDKNKLFFLSFTLSDNPVNSQNIKLMNYSFLSSIERSFDELKKKFPVFLIILGKIVYKLLSKFVFQDFTVFEKNKIKKNLKKIIEGKKIDVVVAFVMPYGLLEVGEYVKELGCKWVIDIGDPISNNVARKNDGKEFSVIANSVNKKTHQQN